MTPKVYKVLTGNITELITIGILAEIVIRNPDAQVAVMGILGAVVMAGVNGRSRRGTGIGSNPPPENPGGGGSMGEVVITQHRAPHPSRTGFTDNPPDSLKIALRARAIGMFLGWIAGCGTPNAPTQREIKYIPAINACVDNSKTPAQYNDCRTRINQAYGVDGGTYEVNDGGAR